MTNILCYTGSLNPVKTGAVLRALHEYTQKVEVIGIEVASGVPDQPLQEETFTGAKTRAVNLKKMFAPDEEIYCLYIGIEGGVMDLYNNCFAFGCVHIIDTFGSESTGTSALFPLPEIIASQVKNRKELGKVIDELSGKKNSKQHGGAIGYLTGEVISREELYFQGVIAALTPFIHLINPEIGVDISQLSIPDA